MFGAATQNGVGIGIGNIPTLTSLPYNIQLNLAVRALFASGEPGFWLDPSDLSTMFQDVAGTTPVTAVEQPVGIILDKSQGLVLGAELITLAANRNFTSDTGFWTKDAGVTIGSGACTFASVASNGGIINTLPLVVGGVYSITYTIATITSGGIQGTCNSTRGTAQTTPGTYTEIICAPVGGYVGIVSSTAGTSGTVTSISVKRLLGTHYYQSTAGVRPVLSARVNLLTKTEQFDDAAWGKQGAAATPVLVDRILAPDGTTTGDIYVEDTTTAIHRLYEAAGTYPTGVQFTMSASFYRIDTQYGLINLSLGAGTYASAVFDLDAKTVANTGAAGAGWAVIGTTCEAQTNGWVRCKLTLTAGDAGANVSVGPNIATTIGAYGLNSYLGASRKIGVWGADFRPSDQATGLIPTYQRVNTSTDYDTASFPLYLSGNGTQWMQCAAQDYTGVNKMLLVAGVRKLTDAATGMVYELSTDAGTLSGGLYFASKGASPNDYLFGIRITTQETAQIFVTPPSTNVLSLLADSAGGAAAADMIVRKNGAVQSPTYTGALSAGNFGNYPAYLFSRAGTSLFFTGNIYQLIARGSTVASNAAQIASTEAYTNSKTKAY